MTTRGREDNNLRARGPQATPAPAPAPPLPWLLRRTNQRYLAAIRSRLAESGFEGLPQPGYWALRILAGGAADASLLSNEMGVSKQAVSKLVDTLASSGFLDRRPNEADRRRTDLQLSAKGRQAAAVILEAVRTVDQTFATELGTGRFSNLIETLVQLTEKPAL